MPKSHPPYPAEFKRRLVELVRAGRNPEELAEKFEPTRSRSGTGFAKLTAMTGVGRTA
jgi:transposase